MSRTRRAIDSLRSKLLPLHANGSEPYRALADAMELLETFALPMNRLVDLLHNGAAAFGRADMDIDSEQKGDNNEPWGVQQERDMSWGLVHRLGAGMRAHEHVALDAFAAASGAVPDAKRAADARTEGALVSLGAELAQLDRRGPAAVALVNEFVAGVSAAVRGADGGDTAEAASVRDAWDKFTARLRELVAAPAARVEQGVPGAADAAVVGKDAINRFASPSVVGMARALATLREVATRATQSAAAAASALVSVLDNEPSDVLRSPDERLVFTVVRCLSVAAGQRQPSERTAGDAAGSDVLRFVNSLHEWVRMNRPDERELNGDIERLQLGLRLSRDQAHALMQIELSYMHEARTLAGDRALFAAEVSDPDALLRHMQQYGEGVRMHLERSEALREIEQVLGNPIPDPPLTGRQQEALWKYRDGAWRRLVDTEVKDANPAIDRWTHAVTVAAAVSPALVPASEVQDIKAFIKGASDSAGPLREALGTLQRRMLAGRAANMEATSRTVRARLERLRTAFEANLPPLYAMVKHDYAADAENKGDDDDALRRLLAVDVVRDGGESIVRMALARLGFDMALVDRTGPLRALLDAFLALLGAPHSAAEHQAALSAADQWLDSLERKRAGDGVALAQQRIFVQVGERLEKALREANEAARDIAAAYTRQVARAEAAEARAAALAPVDADAPLPAGPQWAPNEAVELSRRMRDALLSVGGVFAVPRDPDRAYVRTVLPMQTAPDAALETYLDTYRQWATDTGGRLQDAASSVSGSLSDLSRRVVDETRGHWKALQKSASDAATAQRRADALSVALRASNDLNFSLGSVLEVLARLPAAGLTAELDEGPPPRLLQPADDLFLRRLVGSYETLARLLAFRLVMALSGGPLRAALVDYLGTNPRTARNEDVTAILYPDDDDVAENKHADDGEVAVTVGWTGVPAGDAALGGLLVELAQQWESFSADVIRAHTSAVGCHLVGVGLGAAAHATRIGAARAVLGANPGPQFDVARAAVPLRPADEDGAATHSDRAAAGLLARLVEHVRQLQRLRVHLQRPEAKVEETSLEAVDCTREELTGARSTLDRMVLRDAVYAMLSGEDLDPDNALPAQDQPPPLVMVEEQAAYPEEALDRRDLLARVRAVPPAAFVMPAALRDELRDRVRRALRAVATTARQAREIASLNGGARAEAQRVDARALVTQAFRDVAVLSSAQEKIARDAANALIHETARLCLNRVEALKRALQLRLGAGARRAANDGTQAITRLVYRTLPELDRVALEIVNHVAGTNDRDVATLAQRSYKEMRAADDRFYLVQTRTLAFASEELGAKYGYADTAMEQLVLALRQLRGGGPRPREALQAPLGASTERGIEQLQRFVGLVAAHLGNRDASFVLRARGFRVIDGRVVISNALALRVVGAVPMPPEIQDMEERGARGEARPSDAEPMAAYHEYMAYLEVKHATQSDDLDAVADHRRRGAALWRAADAVCQPAITGQLEAVIQYVRSAHSKVYDRASGKLLLTRSGGGTHASLVAVGMARLSGTDLPPDGRTISQDTYEILSRALASEWARVYLAQAVAHSASLAGGIVLAVPPDESGADALRAATVSDSTFLDSRPVARPSSETGPRSVAVTFRHTPEQTTRLSEARANALDSLVRWYLDAHTWAAPKRSRR